RAEAEGIDPPRGIAWRVYPVSQPENKQTNLLSGDVLNPAGGTWEFASPDNLCLLALEYSRPLGSVRAVGSLTLHSVSLKPNN
ncbi:MAG: hypothetical protein JO091_03010, partial [Acidobacteriaceae bacterium]|nr:hypothetical protein [Acidobacteriaceae bacterium]